MRAAGVLEVLALTVPTSLGSTVLMYSQIAPAWLPQGLAACFLALAVTLALNARGARPVHYQARLFEAATMAALLLQSVPQWASWGVADTPSHRLGWVCLAGTLAALWVGWLWWLRADRLTRFIPTSVYAGLESSAAVVLAMGQVQLLQNLAAQGTPPAQLWTITGLGLLAGVATLVWRPQWPLLAFAAATGAVMGALWSWQGLRPVMLSAAQLQWQLPVWGAAWPLGPGTLPWPWWLSALQAGVLVGSLLFLNENVTGQMTALVSDHQGLRPRDRWAHVGSCLWAGATGSAPISGSLSGVLARRQVADAPTLGLAALAMAVVYLSGLLAQLPLAALAATMLLYAWRLWDRPTFGHLGRWLRGQPVASHQLEDVLLVLAVMVVYLWINLGSAVLAGLTLGLLLHAHRHTRQPVRRLSTGQVRRSRCARSPQDQAWLQTQGGQLLVIELDGHQFFASASQLNRALREQLPGHQVAVLDWSSVRDIDSSLAQMMARLEGFAQRHQVTLLHCGCTVQGGNVATLLREHQAQARLLPDLDHALELAEDLLLARHPEAEDEARTLPLTNASLFQGLDPATRQRLASRFQQHELAAGQVLVQQGDTSDGLWVVLSGRASVLVTPGTGPALRVAGVRTGALVGEIGLLDQAPRSATVVADTPLTAAHLSQAALATLAQDEPQVAQHLLTHIALQLASRLRDANLLVQGLQQGDGG